MAKSCWRFVGTHLPTTFSFTNHTVITHFVVVGRGEGVGEAGGKAFFEREGSPLRGSLPGASDSSRASGPEGQPGISSGRPRSGKPAHARRATALVKDYIRRQLFSPGSK